MAKLSSSASLLAVNFETSSSLTYVFLSSFLVVEENPVIETKSHGAKVPSPGHAYEYAPKTNSPSHVYEYAPKT